MIRAKLPGALTIITAAACLALTCAGQVPANPEVASEPELTVVDQELFDAGLGEGWELPPGWTQVVAGDGFAVRIAAAQAGVNSVAQPEGSFSDVAVDGHFTFLGVDGTAQLFARDSAAGAYVAQLDFAGRVTLEKRDGSGVAVSSWRANAEPQAVPGSERLLHLSAMGGALRVSVDGIDILTVKDAVPLPPGSNKIGAVFATPAGALMFDNHTVWAPSDEKNSADPLPPTMGREAAGSESSGAPGNDMYVDRLIAATGRYHDAGNNAGASIEMDEPVPTNGADITNTVWYEFTPATTKPYRLTSAGSSFNTVMAIYTGVGGLGSVTEVASSDDVTGSQQAQLTLTLTAAQTYYIQLGGRSGATGNFEFFIIDPSDALVPATPTISSTATGAPFTPVANLGRTNHLQPVMAWSPRPTVTPYTYVAQLSTVANFSSIVASSGAITEPTRFWQIAPALSLPGVPAGQKYYWRVAAMNFLGQASTPSAAYSFTLDTHAPQPPLLVSPALNGVVATQRPTLTWKAVADANRYRARIATNFSGTTVVPGAEAEVSTLAYTPAVNIPQGEYWYCVEARDAAGNWSGFVGEKRHFIVNLSLTPANGANMIVTAPRYTRNVVLTWAKIPGATYIVEIDRDSSFSDTDEYDAGTSATYTLTNMPVGTYFWKVRVNGINMHQALARSFNITPALPAAPLIQKTGAQPGAVTSGGFTNDQTPVFDWTVPANWITPPSGSSVTYELQLATNNAFTQMVAGFPVQGIGVSDFEWSATTLAPGTYFWRVRVVTNLGLPGAFSAAYRFTVDLQAPVAPQLVSPAVSGVVGTLRPTLTWKAVADATRYRARITTNFSGTTVYPGAEAEVAALTYTPTFDVPQGEYWFCVESRDAAGNWSGFVGEKRRFVINVSLTPANGANLIASAPTYRRNVGLTWTKVPGATYILEIATDSSFSITENYDAGTSASYTLTNMPLGTYFWRVRVNGIDMPQALARHFHVTPALPVAPVIQTTGAQPGAVTHGGVTTDDTPTFDWTVPTNWVSLAPGASITYELQVSANNTFTQLVAPPVQGIFDSHHEWQATSLTPGTTYYWRVRAVTNLGLAGAYSAVYRFTLN
jgi:hypothetical protein